MRHWKVLGVLMVLAVLCIIATACNGLIQNRYIMYNSEVAPEAASAVIMGANAVQVPFGLKAAVQAGEVYDQDTGDVVSGAFIQHGTFTRSADLDAAAAVQSINRSKNATGGQTAPQGVGSSDASGTGGEISPTVNDNDTVSPSIEVPSVIPGG